MNTPPQGQFAAFDLGWYGAYAVGEGGALSKWGYASELPAGSYTQVAGGEHDYCALDADGLLARLRREVDPGSTMSISGVTYDLVQFHFHGVSEHTVDGAHLAAEVHFVHAGHDDPTKLAVVGFWLDDVVPGVVSDALSAGGGLAFHDARALPVSEEPTALGGGIDLGATFAEILQAGTIHYTGSLTTPPCTEGVEFFLKASVPTVQQGVWAASAGDVICVYPGTYAGQVSFDGADVDLVGIGGSDLTVITGDGDAPVLRVLSGESGTVAGFTFTGAVDGPGVYVRGSSLVFLDVQVYGNTNELDSAGGGVSLHDSNVTIADSVVSNNYNSYEGGTYGVTLYGSGAGIYAADTALSLDNVLVSANWAGGYC